MLATLPGGGAVKAPCFDPRRSGGAGAEPLPSCGLQPALDPLETSSRPQCPPDDLEGDVFFDCNPDAVPFEHRGWSRDRRRVYASMCRTEMPVTRRIDFAQCCSRVHVFRDTATGEVEARPETCKDRFCLRCGQSRSRRIAVALECRMKPAADRLMFITLTVRGLPSDRLVTLLERLRNAWKQLRRLDGWRLNVDGGGIMLEVKWSATSGGHWHPHYHIICEGRWVDEAWLRAAWRAITGDSKECKVEPIKDPEKALGYVVKYASKPMDSSYLRRPGRLDEAMVTLKGVRLCALFGTWYGTPLNAKEPEDGTEVLTTWSYEGTTDDLGRRAAKGEADAGALLQRVNALLAIRALRYERRRGNASVCDPPQAGDAASGG